MTWRTETDVSGYPVRRSEDAARRYSEAGHWTDETLVDEVRLRLREDPDRTLVIEGGRRLTRAQAWDQALRLSAYFRARGLRPGDTVSFQLPNWSEAIALVLAARMCGLVVNPIQPIYREAEVAYILGDCRSKMVFTPQTFRGFDHAGLIARLRPALPDLRDVVVLRGEAEGATRWEDAIGRAPIAEADLPTVDAAAVMMVMYTSGTTSRPKGVLHSHQTYGFKPKHMHDVWGLAADDVVFMPSPISHINGIFWGIDVPWRYGLTSVLMDAWSPSEGVQLIKKHGCTVVGGATPFLQQIIEAAETHPALIESLRLFFCGGASVSADLIRKASAANPACLFVRAYGCTETPTTSMGSRQSPADIRAETDGEVFAPTEVRIVTADTGQDAAEGEDGEILVRGPEQFLGYLHPEDNAAAFDADGYFRTGDLGRRVHGRHLMITGRKKDIIIRSGENISPKEVEDILLRHPDIADVAIVAMPNALTGERACAFVVPRGEVAVDLPSLRRFLTAAGIARQKFPEHLVIVADLPRVPTGKVRKDVLRDEARRIAEAR